MRPLLLPLLIGCSNATAPAEDTWSPETGPTTIDTEPDDTTQTERVVFNEVLADNEEGETNEFGSHGDWLELYNNGSTAVDITGWGLMDGGASEAWIIDTPLVLAPGQFLLIWCDEVDDKDATALHATFKLSRNGEMLTLLDETSERVDSVEYPGLDVDQAWGRRPDGAGGWDYMVEPTPGANNL